MKLDRLVICALATTAALACGCSSTTSTVPARTAPLSAEAASIPGTTNLMSAHLAGPAPRVGKAHLTELDDEGGADDTSEPADLDAPKEARRSDGSRRGGGFGSTK